MTTYKPTQPGVYAFIAFALGGQSTAALRTAVSVTAVEANGQRYENGQTIFVCKGAVGALLTLEAVPSPNSDAG